MSGIRSYTAVANARELNSLLHQLQLNRESELFIRTGEQNAQAAINFYRRVTEEKIAVRTIAPIELDMAALPIFLAGQDRLIAYRGEIRLTPLKEKLQDSNKMTETDRSRLWDYQIAEMIADVSRKSTVSDRYRLNTVGALHLIKLRLVLNMNQAIDHGLATNFA